MRKTWAQIGVVLMSLTLLAGCSEKDQGKSKLPQDGEVVTVEDGSETENSGVDIAEEEPAVVEVDEAVITPEIFPEEKPEYADIAYKRVTVHDPSVIKANGSYYVFGSHMAWAKSDDLITWSPFKTNINSDYAALMGEQWENYSKTPGNPNLSGNLWAPDIIYNESMGKYCIYMSVNGNDWKSSIVLLTSDQIDGPYEYIGPVVYSGFNDETVGKTDVYQVLGEGAELQRYQSTNRTKLNAIDPNLRYDEEGNLWMAFGSWFGGIYIMKLDKETGLRDYTYTYETIENESDQYYGYKIAGGNAVSGEGAYINKFGDHYFLFMSYGGLTAEGGYQMRIFRSEKINGPYVDEEGVSAIYKRNTNNLSSEIGVRTFGSYKFSGHTETHVAQGHNSTLLDDDGKMYNVYHTRFAGGKNGIPEAHEVRVTQMFLNKSGWLVAAPYEYSGETLPETGYSKEEMIGEYEFVIHKPDMFYQKVTKVEIGIAKTHNIALYSNGAVVGDFTGTWAYEEGTPYMTITIDGVEYHGVFIRQANQTERKLVMTFTALGDNVTVMASKK